MGSFLSISKASDWQFHYTPVQKHLKGIYFLNYNTIFEKNTINDIALLADKLDINNNNNKKQISGVTYTAKFECNAIFEDHGLLSPGYYDTDISIFNKQGYPITVLLNVIINNSNSSANSDNKNHIYSPKNQQESSCQRYHKVI